MCKEHKGLLKRGARRSHGAANPPMNRIVVRGLFQFLAKQLPLVGTAIASNLRQYCKRLDVSKGLALILRGAPIHGGFFDGSAARGSFYTV